MPNIRSGYLTVGLVLGLTLASESTAGSASESGRSVATVCEVTFTPDRLTISPRPVRVMAEADQAIGELETVRPEAGSGILALETREDSPPPDPSWVIGLDLGEAAPGSWRLELVGSEGSCVGEITLQSPGSRAR